MKLAIITAKTKPYDIKGNTAKYINFLKDVINNHKDVTAIVFPANAVESFFTTKEKNTDVKVPTFFKLLSSELPDSKKHIIYPSLNDGRVYSIFRGKIEVSDLQDSYKIDDGIKLYAGKNCHKIPRKGNGISAVPYFFDGETYFKGGVVLFSEGKIKVETPEYTEGITIIDTETIEKIAEGRESATFTLCQDNKKPPEFDAEKTYNTLVNSIREYFDHLSIKKAVVGLSGGIDSAIVATLGVEALGKENVTGLLMPSEFSTSHSVTDAEQLAKKLGIEHHLLPIKNVYNTYNDTLKDIFAGTQFDVTEENIQARIRGTLVMAYANKFSAMALNTSNKSELMVGYGTLYGDLVGSIGVIGDVFKTEVYRLAEFINRNGEIIPEHIITKAPSAELHPGQKDQDALPDYNSLDKILVSFLYVMDEDGLLYNNQNLTGQIIDKHKEFYGTIPDTEEVAHTLNLIFRNYYKGKQVPPKIKLNNYPELNLPLLHSIKK